MRRRRARIPTKRAADARRGKASDSPSPPRVDSLPIGEKKGLRFKRKEEAKSAALDESDFSAPLSAEDSSLSLDDTPPKSDRHNWKSRKADASEYIAPTEEELSEETVWESEELKTKKGVLLPAIFVIGMVAALVAGWQFYQRDGAIPTVDFLPAEEGIYFEDASEESQTEAVDLVEESRVTLEGFYSAQTVEELAKFVRGGVATLPYMKFYYKSRSLPQDQIKFIGELVSQNRKQGDFWGTSVVFESGRREMHILEKDEKGSFKIAWKFMVGFSGYDLEEIVSQSPEGLYRLNVMIRPSEMHVYEFADPTEWASYSVEDGDTDFLANAYIRKNDPKNRAIEEFRRMTRNDGWSMVVLLVSFPQNTRARNAMVIEEVVQVGWVAYAHPELFEDEVEPSPETASYAR